MSYNKHQLPTLHEHLEVTSGVVIGSVFLIFLVFCVMILLTGGYLQVFVKCRKLVFIIRHPPYCL
jgi:hypothetical protein